MEIISKSDTFFNLIVIHFRKWFYWLAILECGQFQLVISNYSIISWWWDFIKSLRMIEWTLNIPVKIVKHLSYWDSIWERVRKTWCGFIQHIEKSTDYYYYWERKRESDKARKKSEKKIHGIFYCCCHCMSSLFDVITKYTALWIHILFYFVRKISYLINWYEWIVIVLRMVKTSDKFACVLKCVFVWIWCAMLFHIFKC